MLRKIIAIFIAALMLFSSAIISSAEPTTQNITKTANLPDGFSEVCSNDNFIFYIKSETYEIALTDKRSGKVWYSNPTDRDSDTIALGKNKMNLNSVFEVTYRDLEREVDDNVGSYVGAIMNGAVKTKEIKNGIVVYYRFNDIQTIIPLQYKLNKDGFSCTVLSKEIRESEKFPILSITLLSYFGAGGVKDNGYLFVPDGSGAVINFNNGKKAEKAYSQDLYGRDEAFDVSSLNVNTQTARLPVFGIKSNNDAFLAVITSGEALAKVGANVSGQNSSYNKVYTTFSLRKKDTYVMGQGSGSTGNNVTIYDENKLSVDNLTVRYFPLERENADYSGMAVKYREYLINKSVIKKQETNRGLHLEFMGAIRVEKSFLGIPYDKDIELTSTDDIASIVKKVRKSAKVPIAVKYTKWNEKDLDNSVNNKASVVGAVGGESGLEELSDKFKKTNVKFFLETDFYKTSNFPLFDNKKNSGVTTLYDKPLSLFEFSFIDYFKDPFSSEQHLISFRKTKEYAEDFLDSFNDLPGSYSIALNNVASLIYSDYSVEGWTRQDSAKVITDLSKKFSKKNQIMVTGGNYYALNGASTVIDAPDTDSKFDIVDEAVPFYAIAMSGAIDYSYAPINLSSNTKEYFLKAVETGASVHFQLVGKNENYLKDNGFSGMFSVKAANWINTAKEYAKKIKKINSATDGTAIKNHLKIAEGVYKTVYENGTEIFVNYNENDVEVENQTLKAVDYLIKKGSATK